ncbi:bifunctional folylpolyglutamate synthase/dihydrofolate synthase [Sphingomicrobium marinum]|uniref:bifunctional folylpolyglutamate synthase/dihydrofolate synthase n=1 Tax=Sphingomicrobium marinum TaxID=1227950 RepID=UPI00223E9FFE|nr:folylpolyglutamate synthase/dihydrofolate synthase family protein [Sphingomicrobium marinum]
MADGARSSHPKVQAQLDRLMALGMGGDVLGLERVSALCAKLGNPQNEMPPVFHVAGTNGKGSTIAFLRAALEAAGKSVHVFTSPHLVRFNERIRLAGKLIDDEALAELLEEVLDAAGDIKPTFFEATTAAAFLAFSRTPADATLVEVGLGGRLDATNIIEQPLVTGIASLGLDHQQFLGGTLPKIGAEKAGIAKDGVMLVTQAYPPATEARIAEIAAATGARWRPRRKAWDVVVRHGKLHYRDALGGLELPLPRMPGRHQHHNAGLAIAMLRLQGEFDIPDAAYAAALGWTDWPARLQRLREGSLFDRLPGSSELWVDGGHNPSAAREVAMAVKSMDDMPLTIIFAALTNKDAEGLLAPFDGMTDKVVTLGIDHHDCHPPEWLAELATGMGHDAQPAASLEAAFDMVEQPGRVLVFGSLYLAGQMLAANGTLPD